MRQIILPSLISPDLPYFPTLSQKRHCFREKKLLDIKGVFWVSLKHLLKHFPIKGYSTRYIHKKVKVKVTLYRPPRVQRGSKGIALLFYDLGVRRGWVVSTTPRPLYPRDRPGTHCTRGWVGPRAGLDVCEESRPHRDSIPGPSSP
jgi:hypothetical protein